MAVDDTEKGRWHKLLHEEREQADLRVAVVWEVISQLADLRPLRPTLIQHTMSVRTTGSRRMPDGMAPRLWRGVVPRGSEVVCQQTEWDDERRTGAVVVASHSRSNHRWVTNNLWQVADAV